MAILPSLLLAFISSAKVRSPVKKMLVFVQIIPREISDVVSKTLQKVSNGRSLANDAYGYKSTHDAVINAQNIASRLSCHVKPENLLFVFGETVQSLQSAFFDFANQHSLSYPAEDFYGPIYNEQDTGDDQEYGEPLAIVLCKVINAEGLEPFIGTEKQKSSGDAKRYEITWCEFQKLQERLDKAILHSGSLR
jgi:hypothetical protein